jgi:4-hydroxy-tetrahydrodipicolinate synthase
MKDVIPDGVWPTMITPFTEENEIDYVNLEEMIEWYLKNDINGFFAVCQSSEMFYLSLVERIKLASFIVKKVKGRVPVIASGHISDSLIDQIEELKAVVNTGVDAVVLVTNRLAAKRDSNDIWKRNIENIIQEIPNISIGLYECPYPYKRLATTELLKWCAETGRFNFLKDTSCNIEEIKAKLTAVKGTGLKIFNANSATLLESLKMGVAGYSGVMANFHPDLYVWLLRYWSQQPDKAEELVDFLGLASVIEMQYYPVNAKYYLQLEGLKLGLYSRARDVNAFTSEQKLVIKQFYNLSKNYAQRYNIK